MLYNESKIINYKFMYRNILPIVINGKGKSGKDTFVQLINNFCTFSESFKLYNLSTIDPIKEMAKIIGLDIYKKDEKDRKFLSDLKNLVTNYNDYSYNYVVDKIKNFSLDYKHIVFIHCREIEEIEKFKDKLNVITLLIKRNEQNDIKYGNDADDNVDNYDYDYIINNNSSLYSLEQEALGFADIISKYFSI
jgi:hypothetical protein